MIEPSFDGPQKLKAGRPNLIKNNAYTNREAGRKFVFATKAGLEDAFLEIIPNHTAGSPMMGLMAQNIEEYSSVVNAK